MMRFVCDIFIQLMWKTKIQVTGNQIKKKNSDKFRDVPVMGRKAFNKCVLPVLAVTTM